ncbi:HutD family protein [Paraburkholderia guartelaensis]|uniref:HutD family protein n=1 Tax=Paraburkholderia guartelaensis TaxID=2546446 RepID=A0A4R5LMC0_9BURK|nr:HutD family protein [Paraburkholderia guartelaensis]TDG11004.1 HutD family protein [Paraburkholderia guartelaensis]
MSAIEVHPLDSLPVERWRNGGGVTRTIASDGCHWRISLAEVERDGPYSRFEGIDRLSCVLRGAGVMLREANSVVTLKPYEAVEYDGGLEWHATLIDGPVTALNVMAARSRYRTSIRAIAEPVSVLPGRAVVVVTLRAGCAWRASEGHASGTVEAGQFLIAERLDRAMQLSPVMPALDEPPRTGLPVLVTIEPAYTHE